MRPYAMLFAAALLPATVQADAVAARVPFDDCTLSHHLTSIYSLDGLSKTVQSDLAARLGKLADRGQPYQSSDVLVLNGGPTRRFIRALHSEDKLFVWYEQGGIAVRAHVLVYGNAASSAAPRFESNFVTFNLCAATDAYLDGKSPASGGER
jgi:hypothetical protein